MKESWQSKENVLESAALNEAADSLGENHSEIISNPIHLSEQQLKNQSKIEEYEKRLADSELVRKLSNLESIFDDENIEEDIEVGIQEHSERVDDLLLGDEILLFKKSLEDQGLNSEQILLKLISKYEYEEGVSTWIENWKNFLKLYDISNTKSPSERRAIESIMFRADFSNAASFDTALIRISKSEEISNKTKREIHAEFNDKEISFVSQMDARLKEIKNTRNATLAELKIESENLERLENNISKLETDIESATPEEKEKLKAKLKKQKAKRKSKERRLSKLKIESKIPVAFELRKSLEVHLGKKGRRFLKLKASDFKIALPSNTLPFTNKKNLRAINFVFPFIQLKALRITDIFFNDKLENGGVPSQRNRKMTHFILKSLGYNDDRILSDENIESLKMDLNRLTSYSSIKSGKECLVELGVFRKVDGSVNKKRFQELLQFLKENRSLSDDLITQRIEGRFINQT